MSSSPEPAPDARRAEDPGVAAEGRLLPGDVVNVIVDDDLLGQTDDEWRRVKLTCAGVLLATLACSVAFAADWESPLRTVVALGFVLLVPGLAIAELLPVQGLAQRVAIAVAASLGLETLVAVTLIYIGVYSTALALGLVVAVTTFAVLAALVRAWRSSAARPPNPPQPSAAGRHG